MINSEFNNLSLADKLQLLINGNIYLDSIQYYDYWVTLYSLQSTFIEVYFNKYTGYVDHVKTAEYKDLDKYINRLMITI